MKFSIETISILIALAAVLGSLFGFTVSNATYEDSPALKAWSKFKTICSLYDKSPVMKSVKLSNGNLGYVIVCE